MTPRKILFWIHLTAGTVAGAIILILSVTGALLAFERQITDWSDSSYRAGSTSGERLSMDTLLNRARDIEATMPSSIRVRSDPAAAVEFGFGPDRGALLLDPYTGSVLHRGLDRTHKFFSFVEGLHRWLGATGENRPNGGNITGACNLAFLVLVLSGPFLWWPKNFRWARVRQIFIFQRHLSGKARNFNWHNVLGIWCFIPLLFVVLTGVIMSYGWANSLLYRMSGNEPPPPQTRAAGGESGGRGRENAEAKLPPIDSLFLRAEQQLPDWTRITLRLPLTKSSATFTIEQAPGGRPDRRSQLVLNADTAEVVGWETFSSYNPGRRLRGWARFVHTGEAGGFVGQTLALLVSAAAALLAFTGIAMSWTRFRLWRARPGTGTKAA